MDIGLMLNQSWQVVWRHKFLWLFGFFAGLNGVLFDLLRLFFGAQISSQVSAWWDWAQQPQPVGTLPFDFNLTQADFGRYFMGLVVFLFIVFVVFWIIATIAEAGIIQAVINLERDEPVGVGVSARAGFHWLGRFLAIDAAVFFPWFLIALTAMLIMIVMILAIGYIGINNSGDLSGMFVVLGIGALCLIPLMLLLLPVAWLSFIYRTLAFRDAAVLDHSIRQAVKLTWGVVRKNLGSVALVTLLMMAVQTIGNWAIDLISIPVFAGLAYFGADSVMGTIGGVILTFVTAIVSGVIYAYIATAWTISYRNWVLNSQQSTENSQRLTLDS